VTTTTVAGRVEEYLADRRGLGYQLRKEGQRLRAFARFADQAGHKGPLTVAIALRWARLPEQVARHYQARRLGEVRTLARYLAAREPGTEVPPRDLLGPSYARRPAFIYSAANIAALIEAAGALGPVDSLRPATYATLIGLLACTGLRIGEALALRIDDIDWSTAVLRVRRSKFHKSRLVPLHPSAIEPLRAYAVARDRGHPPLPQSTFFVNACGGPLRYEPARETFAGLVRQALPGVVSAAGARPRWHDLRHTFAVGRLLGWYRDGADVHRTIDLLAVYLGHAKVTCTYWYLTGVPELMAVAAQRFERFAAPCLETSNDTDL
jgi:integrase